MHKFIKRSAVGLAVILALPTAFMGSAFVAGVYQGIQELAAFDEKIDKFEAYTAHMSFCGEIENEDDYNAEPIYRERCGSFFECRNEHLIREYDIVESGWYEYEDVYTEAKYEYLHGEE